MPKMTDDELEECCMKIIANSGDARSKAYEALSFAKEGKFSEADKKLEEANKTLNEAHKEHSKVLKAGANGDLDHETVLLAHAQDHVMSTMTVVDMIKEFINLYKVKKDK
ncbi:MAG: PTS lactose/cellobiose transporter subunit IIA [Bacilli bacterium]